MLTAGVSLAQVSPLPRKEGLYPVTFFPSPLSRGSSLARPCNLAFVLQNQEERGENSKKEVCVARAGRRAYKAGILERRGTGLVLVCRQINGRGKTGS